MLVGIFGFLWFYKFRCVIALAVCFVYIFEDNIFFYLQFTDDEVMITWWFCSAESSGIDKSELNFLAAKYVVNLIIYCFFRQIVGIYSFVVMNSHVVISAVLCWKAALLMKRLLIEQKSTRCCLLIVIWNTTSKTSNTIITGMLFDFFSYFSVPVPS